MNQRSREEIVTALNDLIEQSFVLHEQALRNKHNHLLQLLEDSEFDAAQKLVDEFASELQVQRVVIERERYQDAELDDVLQEAETEERMEAMKQEWRRLLADGVPFNKLPLDADLPFLDQFREQAKLDPTGIQMREFEKKKRKLEDL
jgi:SpoVK/Ycf46/Vps4 family AAA+-type ATPase